MARTTYRIRGIAPPDLPRDSATRRMFWTWVRDVGLRVKDQELARGLDRHGNKLRPISAKTRKYRRSAMTAARGRALSGPPLMPARELSRTRSLLAGRATDDAAIFYWRFDPFIGNSWGVALAGQAKAGRDVIGLSPEGVARVRAEAWDRWRKWKAGTLKATQAAATEAPGVPQVGTYGTEHATFGIGAQSMPQFKPGKATGGMTWPEWQRYFRQANPTPVAIPGRPAGNYNRLLAHTWGQAPPAGPRPAPAPTPTPKAPKAPKAPKPRPTPAAKPKTKPPAPRKAPTPTPAPAPPPKPGEFATIDQVREWAAATFPNFKARHFDGGGLSVEAWNALTPELDRLARIWPEVAARLEWLHEPGLDWSKQDANAIAVADITRGRYMAFNPAYWSRPMEEIRADAARAERVGFSPRGITDLGMYPAHEWGHLLEAYLREHQVQTLVEFRKLFVDASGNFDPSKAARISDYAATKEIEAFAETFLAATMQPAEMRISTTRRFASYFGLIKQRGKK